MIVKMKHLDLICVASERNATLEKLRSLGAVHLDLAQSAGAGVAEAKGAASEAEQAVRHIQKARGKAPKGAADCTVEQVLDLVKEREALKGEKDRLEREIRTYAPYGDFDPVLAAKLRATVEGLDTVVALPEKLPEERLSKLQERVAAIGFALDDMEKTLAGCDEGCILKEFPGLADRIAFEQAKELLQDHGAVAVISGWIPVSREADLMAEVQGTKTGSLFERSASIGWGVLLREAAEGEVPPTLIEPPKFFKSVKALFEGLGIAPGYTEADVSVPFMCYFSLFFAMLVGDGGYGAIFLAATLWAWKKFGTSPWVKLLTVFSVGTILWGLLSNTWFGAGIPWCADWPTVKWLGGVGAEQGHEYDNMMFLCFTIGVTHLMLARLWNGISMINSRACLSQFGWAGMVLFMYLVTNSIVGIFPGIPTWAYWMFGVSFGTVFIQAKGIDKGMLFLNAMSVLGDIISYVRLFAVGLASVKVAENFNMMAVDLGLPIWIKWLPLVLILLVGHGLNLAMAGLSILVHAVRLNTLEFSNHKGISWAGYQFKPFHKTEK